METNEVKELLISGFKKAIADDNFTCSCDFHGAYSISDFKLYGQTVYGIKYKSELYSDISSGEYNELKMLCDEKIKKQDEKLLIQKQNKENELAEELKEYLKN